MQPYPNIPVHLRKPSTPEQEKLEREFNEWLATATDEELFGPLRRKRKAKGA
jgi:hypothetical protein